jgi:hypothetical protein
MSGVGEPDVALRADRLARHAVQLRVAVVWPVAGPDEGPTPRHGARGPLLAPGLSLACQQAMSATNIYVLVLMRVLTLGWESA